MGNVRIVVDWGRAERLELEVDSETAVDVSEGPAEPLADARDAAAKALAEPLDFPPIRKAVVPGDQVTLAVEEGTPDLPALVAAAVECLLAAEVLPADITILRPLADRGRAPLDPTSALPEAVRTAIKHAWHDPHDRGSLSYVAATAAGHRVYLNRAVADADFVLPIGWARPETFPRTAGFGSVYPRFSDAETLHRHRRAELAAEDKAPAHERAEIDEVGRLTGLLCGLIAAPSDGSKAGAVWAGDPKSISKAATAWLKGYERPPQPRRFPLVLCAVPGDSGLQTWETIGRVLSAAAELVAPQGAVVVLSELGSVEGDRIWGHALRRVTHDEPGQELVDRLRRDAADDAVAALGITVARRRGQVYLRSLLPAESVEELGLAALESDADVQRLVRRAKGCLIVGQAGCVMPRFAGA